MISQGIFSNPKVLSWMDFLFLLLMHTSWPSADESSSGGLCVGVAHSCKQPGPLWFPGPYA